MFGRCLVPIWDDIPAIPTRYSAGFFSPSTPWTLHARSFPIYHTSIIHHSTLRSPRYCQHHQINDNHTREGCHLYWDKQNLWILTCTDSLVTHITAYGWAKAVNHSLCSNWCNLFYCRQCHTNTGLAELRTAEQVVSSATMQRCSHEWSVDTTHGLGVQMGTLNKPSMLLGWMCGTFIVRLFTSNWNATECYEIW